VIAGREGGILGFWECEMGLDFLGWWKMVIFWVLGGCWFEKFRFFV
jgi:hypothetical protein